MTSNEVVLDSILTCPHCGHAEQLRMPTEACLFFHPCAAFGAVLRPLPGHCCVFCSYGSVRCPSMQQESPGCG